MAKTNKIIKPNLAKIKDIRQRRRTYLKYVKDFYNTGNRAHNEKDGICSYSATEYSPGCAIGQFVSKLAAQDMDDCLFDGSSTIAGILANKQEAKSVPKWMKELGTDFLTDIQDFHDTKANWNDNGVSDEGMKVYRTIKIAYHL